MKWATRYVAAGNHLSYGEYANRGRVNSSTHLERSGHFVTQEPTVVAEFDMHWTTIP